VPLFTLHSAGTQKVPFHQQDRISIGYLCVSESLQKKPHYTLLPKASSREVVVVFAWQIVGTMHLFCHPFSYLGYACIASYLHYICARPPRGILSESQAEYMWYSCVPHTTHMENVRHIIHALLPSRWALGRESPGNQTTRMASWIGNVCLEILYNDIQGIQWSKLQSNNIRFWMLKSNEKSESSSMFQSNSTSQMMWIF